MLLHIILIVNAKRISFEYLMLFKRMFNIAMLLFANTDIRSAALHEKYKDKRANVNLKN